ncbi:MAG: diacylglycerol kinase family protein [Oscillospiraceae bacterium]|nr:diacylglycerol kinase family protein [Oscillospiraceae bacterium]
MKKQLKSFGCAIKGFFGAVCSEGHLRFHLVAAVYVLVFSSFYNFSAAQWAVLIILIALVIAAELVNTAIENTCDAITEEQNANIGRAKDMAAGAVLVLSIAAAAIAVIFFWNLEVIKNIFAYFSQNIPMLILLIISAVVSVLFIAISPAKIIKKFKKD